MMPQSRFYNIGTNVNYFIKTFFHRHWPWMPLS